MTRFVKKITRIVKSKNVKIYRKRLDIFNVKPFLHYSNNGVEKYLSAVSGSTVTTVLPFPSFLSNYTNRIFKL